MLQFGCPIDLAGNVTGRIVDMAHFFSVAEGTQVIAGIAYLDERSSRSWGHTHLSGTRESDSLRNWLHLRFGTLGSTFGQASRRRGRRML